MIWGYQHMLAQKIVYENLEYFKNLCEFYWFFLCDFFNQNRLITQNHRLLTSSIEFGDIRRFLAQKIRQEKLRKFIKILNNIKCLYITFCAQMSRYSHYIYFLQEAFSNFGLRVLEHFGPRKIYKFTKVLNYVKSSCIIFYVRMSRYFNYIYFLLEKLTYFGLKGYWKFSSKGIGTLWA